MRFADRNDWRLKLAFPVFPPSLPANVLGMGDAGSGTSSFLGDFFGEHVAWNSKWLMVGAANDDNFPGLKDRHRMLPNPPLTFAGHAYGYNYDSGSDQWLLVQKLSSDGPHTGAFFGGHPHLLYKRCACPDAGAFLSNAAQ